MKTLRACFKNGHLFSAKGASLFQPGATPQEACRLQSTALKARSMVETRRLIAGTMGRAFSPTAVELRTVACLLLLLLLFVLLSNSLERVRLRVRARARPCLPESDFILNSTAVAFSPESRDFAFSWGVAPGWNDTAPLALNRQRLAACASQNRLFKQALNRRTRPPQSPIHRANCMIRWSMAAKPLLSAKRASARQGSV